MARRPKTTVAYSEVSEAIDIAGPALFGANWIGRLAAAQRAFLAKHDRASLFIGQYPPDIADRLSRLIGQDFHMGVQRATVLHWLFANDLVKGTDLKCDREALNAALAAKQAKRRSRKRDGTPGNERGRPPKESEAVIFKMRSDLQNGEIDVDTLSGATGEFLKERYGASINTCFAARKVVLDEWHRQHGEAVSKIPNK